MNEIPGMAGDFVIDVNSASWFERAAVAMKALHASRDKIQYPCDHCGEMIGVYTVLVDCEGGQGCPKCGGLLIKEDAHVRQCGMCGRQLPGEPAHCFGCWAHYNLDATIAEIEKQKLSMQNQVVLRTLIDKWPQSDEPVIVEKKDS